MLNQNEIEQFRVLCEKHFKLKFFSNEKIVIQAESEGARLNWGITAMVLGIFGLALVLFSISVFINDEDLTIGYIVLGLSILLIISAVLSYLMMFRKANTLEFDVNNNIIDITINRGSNQVIIDDGETEETHQLTDDRFSTNIATIGGIVFSNLFLHLVTGRNLILDNVKKTNITDTQELYVMLMLYTDS